MHDRWMGRGGPPPWVADIVRSFGGPDLAGPARGPRARRGDVRAAILDVLSGAEAPLNGYQVIQQISERTHGAWKPSPGSVYPTIQQLEDEGLLETRGDEGRRELHLTAEGRRYVEDNPELMAETWRPFEDPEPTAHGPAGGISDLAPAVKRLMSAVGQVMTQGTDAQRVEAIDILHDARRRLYGLLAEEDS